jgi:large subunit ribosomal protein L24
MSHNKLKIRKGDNVIVTAGKDKGKKGVVTRVITASRKIVIEGVNVAKKHMKPSRVNPQGGIVSMEKPIDVSNVSLLDPKTDLPTRIGFKTLKDGKKVRFAKKSGEVIDNVN